MELLKKLLKLLAVRGLTVLIDEHNTSKMCPCGQSELIDTTQGSSGKRVRVHKTDGGACAVLSRVNETATVQMLLAAGAAMRHLEWPKHLARSKRA